MKLIMCKGLPASGKSTWAKEQIDKSGGNMKRVNRDELRAMIDNGKWSGKNEKFIIETRDNIIVFGLMHGYSIIVDDTNLPEKNKLALQKIVEDFNNLKYAVQSSSFKKVEPCTFETKDFTDVPVETCIERDAKRPNPVGKGIILDFYRKFLKPAPKVIAYDKNIPNAIICDIDGTLALFGNKNPYDRDFENDELNKPVADLLGVLADSCHQIIIMSGRMDKNKKVTEDWLKKNGIEYDKLLMRVTDDVRKDSIIKKEIYENNIKGKYNVSLVLDDRNQVVEMWRDLGLTCLQVADGNF